MKWEGRVGPELPHAPFLFERLRRRRSAADTGRYHRLVARSAAYDPVEGLIVDLLEWLEPRPRPYPEVLEAWRTSCPRLPVWEEANERGLVARRRSAATGAHIYLTPTGARHLHLARRTSSSRRSNATLS